MNVVATTMTEAMALVRKKCPAAAAHAQDGQADEAGHVWELVHTYPMGKIEKQQCARCGLYRKALPGGTVFSAWFGQVNAVL